VAMYFLCSLINKESTLSFRKCLLLKSTQRKWNQHDSTSVVAILETLGAPPSYWLDEDLAYLRDKITAPTAKAIPTAATQVIEDSDICSTAAPPIPAPAAIAS
jgi:hypothetical protein